MDEITLRQVDAKPHQVEEDEITIDLYDLFYLFLQKLPGILVSMVLGGLLVGMFTYFFIAPKYQATAKLYIVSSSSDSVVNLTDLQIGTSLTSDYRELVLSRPMLESVIENLGLDVDVDGLKGMLTISNPSNTRILNITATSTDPVIARDVANEMAWLAVDWLPEMMNSNTPSVPEEAVLPERKSSPSYVRNTLVGALVCMAVYYGIAVLGYLHDDSIRTAGDLERYFEIVPLATIPEEKDIHDHAEDRPEKSKKKSKKGRRSS